MSHDGDTNTIKEDVQPASGMARSITLVLTQGPGYDTSLLPTYAIGPSPGLCVARAPTVVGWLGRRVSAFESCNLARQTTGRHAACRSPEVIPNSGISPPHREGCLRNAERSNPGGMGRWSPPIGSPPVESIPHMTLAPPLAVCVQVEVSGALPPPHKRGSLRTLGRRCLMDSLVGSTLGTER